MASSSVSSFPCSHLHKSFNLIENGNAVTARTLVTTAWDLCQRLGYHLLRPPTSTRDAPLRAAQESLFWTVYELDKGLSLRLSLSSNIRDHDITLPVKTSISRHVKMAKFYGHVFDELHSPRAASKPADQRIGIAKAFASELRAIISDTLYDLEVRCHGSSRLS